ncbi:MAG: ribonuclease P protein component [Candidatus Babeliales bacterium]
MKKIVRSLFSFSKPQVDVAFGGATLLARINGIKLLSAPTGLDQATGKMLIIIPRRAGKAHDRNRIRRQIKAIFYGEQLFTTNATYIVLVYEQATGLTFDQLKTFFCQSIKVVAQDKQ